MESRSVEIFNRTNDQVDVGEIDIGDIEQQIEVLRTESARLAGDYADPTGQAYLTFTHPVNSQKAYSMFGLTIGTIPLFSAAVKMAANEGLRLFEAWWVVPIVLLMIAATGLIGYLLGSLAAKTAERMRCAGLLFFLASLPLIGFLWGMAAGIAGGIFLFVFGAVAGAIVGGAVGAAAVPVFAIIHITMRTGDMIERNQLLPVLFAISGSIGAAVLGL